jgi:ribosomal protein S18 acetylase RimI-like enzyme
MNQTQLGAPVRVRRAGPADAEELTALLAGLSATSSFHRFLAGLGMPNPTLVRGLLRDEPDRGALLAVQREPAGESALGHACWSVTAAGAADIGVVVADAAQGRGIGTALFLEAVDAARRAGAEAIHLDVHPENRRLVAALRRRFGRSAFAWEQGLVGVELPVTALPLPADLVAAA